MYSSLVGINLNKFAQSSIVWVQCIQVQLVTSPYYMKNSKTRSFFKNSTSVGRLHSLKWEWTAIKLSPRSPNILSALHLIYRRLFWSQLAETVEGHSEQDRHQSKTHCECRHFNQQPYHDTVDDSDMLPWRKACKGEEDRSVSASEQAME